MAEWQKFWRLSPPDRWVLAQALAVLPLTVLALWAVGFRRWQAALARLAPLGAAIPGEEAGRLRHARAVARLVETAARRGPCRATCLPRSLALWWLLRRRGIGSDLRLGVRKEAGQLQAHAWVEYRGTVLNDGSDVSARFAAFDREIRPPVGRPG